MPPRKEVQDVCAYCLVARDHAEFVSEKVALCKACRNYLLACQHSTEEKSQMRRKHAERSTDYTAYLDAKAAFERASAEQGGRFRRESINRPHSVRAEESIELTGTEVLGWFWPMSVFNREHGGEKPDKTDFMEYRGQQGSRWASALTQLIMSGITLNYYEPPIRP